MGDRTKDELVSDFTKVVQGIERDTVRYEGKVKTIAQSQADNAKFLADMKAAVKDTKNLTEEKVSELAAAGGTLQSELATAHDLVTARTKSQSAKNIMTNEPGWIREDLDKAKGAIDKLLTDIRKLTTQEQAQAKSDMVKVLYDEDTLEEHPEIFDKEIKDIWKEYADAVKARLKAIEKTPQDVIQHPEVLEQQSTAIEGHLQRLAAALDRMHKRTPPPPPPVPVAPKAPKVTMPHGVIFMPKFMVK